MPLRNCKKLKNKKNPACRILRLRRVAFATLFNSAAVRSLRSIFCVIGTKFPITQKDIFPQEVVFLILVMPATGIEPVRCRHHRILSPARLPVPPRRHAIKLQMGRGGFEPPKQIAADLQSVPFGHSGICPFMSDNKCPDKIKLYHTPTNYASISFLFLQIKGRPVDQPSF